jgi:predicted ATP-dependent Lon-type protease
MLSHLRHWEQKEEKASAKKDFTDAVKNERLTELRMLGANVSVYVRRFVI